MEHVSSLRLIPNMRVWRPCDTVETAVAWRAAIERQNGPTSLILTRQGVPFQQRDAAQLAAIGRGGYVLSGDGEPAIVLIATGSEVGLALAAAEILEARGVSVRVVSMPCVEAFLEQDDNYREAVLPSGITKRVAIEAGSTGLWYRFVGSEGRVVGLDRFGASAPAGFPSWPWR